MIMHRLARSGNLSISGHFNDCGVLVDGFLYDLKILTFSLHALPYELSDLLINHTDDRVFKRTDNNRMIFPVNRTVSLRILSFKSVPLFPDIFLQILQNRQLAPFGKIRNCIIWFNDALAVDK